KAALDAGSDPNEQWYGAPAIYWCSLEGNCEMLELLISSGADVNAVTDSGTSALAAICLYPKEPADFISENIELNKKVTNRVSEDLARDNGWLRPTDTLFFCSTSEKIKLLLASGANPNANQTVGDIIKQTPFLTAIVNERLDWVKAFLTSKKTDLEQRFVSELDTNNTSVLKITDISTINQLNQNNSEGWQSIPTQNTALLYAIEKQNIELVQLLISSGALINNGKQTKKTNNATIVRNIVSPLDVAIEKGNMQIVNLLKSKGAVSFKK
ncbi:MAG: ankyrin repeat domain-containing protein, partial [Bacteroidales bacterium]|nr:ankyrin repeat domain-containing protein [Bacteroidales bacterium]